MYNKEMLHTYYYHWFQCWCQTELWYNMLTKSDQKNLQVLLRW